MDTEASVVPAIELRNNSCCWSVSVAPAEPREAEDASDETRRTSSPPSFAGKLASSHLMSVRSRLQIVLMPFPSRLSNIARRRWLTHGEQRSVFSIFGALNDIFRRMSALCAYNGDKRLIAVLRSEQRFSRRSSIFLPAKGGAPRSSFSSGGSEMEPTNCAARGLGPWLIISDLAALICMLLMKSISTATASDGPPKSDHP